jgi:Xaa-Pro aminopeptidase
MDFNVCDYVNSLPSLDLSLRMPREEYEARIEKVRRELDVHGLDAAVAFGTEYRPGDTGWLSGYDPHIEYTIVIVGHKKVLVLGSPDALHYAEEMMRIGEFRCLAASGIPDADYPGFAYSTMKEALAEACGKTAHNIAVLTPPDVLTLEAQTIIKGAVSGNIIDLSDWMAHCRYMKSEWDLKLMRQAAQLSTWGMDAMMRAIEPGIDDLEVAACADYVMKCKGADRFGFTTIVMSGSRVTGNIGRAHHNTIQDGDLIVLGASARYEGLTSALGRTVVAGKAHPDQVELIQHAHTAFELGAEKVIAGHAARDADLASRTYLESVGLRQMYNFGHGIGWTEVFEKGIASQHSEYDFPVGIAIQLDVGIVNVPFKSLAPERVGLRLEDPFVITHDGATERMTDLRMVG